MTGLDDGIADILSGMPALPPGVGRAVAERLPDILRAIAADILEDAAIMLAFSDLQHEQVVLSITIRPHFAHLDVSTNSEGIAVSHGYDILMVNDRADVHVDRDYRLTIVDHAALMGRHIATEKAVGMVDEARALMRTHAAFAGMDLD